jgi:DNA modification methylase
MSRTAFSASSECVSAFDLISAPSTVKMSRNLSLPQLLKTVQLVLTGNSGDVWRLKGGQSREHHLAVMQDELASLCILAGSRPAHVVFDPFAGTGTTMRVAQQLTRRSIGLELQPEFIELACQRSA